MRKMKILQIACLAVMMMFMVVPAVQANTINLAYGDAYYVGYVFDGVPSGLTNDQTYLTNLLTLGVGASPTTIGSETYDRLNSILSSLPAPSGGSFYDGITVGPTLAVDSITYVMAKYDGPNAGLLVWYLGALLPTDSIVLPTYWGPGTHAYGISNYATWSGGTSVPEPTTLLLLGLGLIGIAGVGRKLRK